MSDKLTKNAEKASVKPETEVKAENQTPITEGVDTAKTEIKGKKSIEFPKGRYSLFGLKKVEGITYEAIEYKMDAGKLVDTEVIGKDVLAVLKHKLHRKIYEKSNIN